MNHQRKGALVQRFTLYTAFLILLCLVLVVRLWFLQVVQGDRYRVMAEGNRIREVALEAQRGDIVDRHGRQMVLNRNALCVFVLPTEYERLEDKDAEVDRLAGILGMDPREIKKKLDRERVQPHRPVLIKKDVQPSVWFFINERQRDFPWVLAETMPVREYPPGEETRAAHVLGYLGEITEKQLQELAEKGYKAGDIVGISGVEAFYEDQLRGQDGKRIYEVNARGVPLRVLGETDPIPGNTLVLSLDRDLQEAVEESLRWGMDRARGLYDRERGKYYKAPGGAVVVMDPRTGEILAMASEPTFSLKEFVGGIDEDEWNRLNDPANNHPLNNRAIVGLYPPGSTFKVITALAALMDLGVTAYSPFHCDHVFTEGEFENFPKTCWGTHGALNFMDSLIQSCDIVYYHIGYQFYRLRNTEGWNTRLQDYSRLFGLGDKSGVDLPNEFAGRVPTPQWKWEFNQGKPEYQRWYPGDTVNMAVGQGDILLTPLQLAVVYAAIANGGVYYRPHVGKEIRSWQGETVRMVEPEKVGDITDPHNPIGVYVSRSALETVRSALKGVTQGKGTAAGAFSGFPLKEIPVAGKTGTAEIFGKQPCAWFACYAPADDPRYVIVVMIEEGGHGGTSAAPVARRILEHIFGLPHGQFVTGETD